MAFISIVGLSVFMLITLVVLIILWIGSIILQIFLSKMKNKWAGLILPTIIFFIALIATIQTAIEIDAGITAILGGFLIGNISTMIYLLIYFFVRRKKKNKK